MDIVSESRTGWGRAREFVAAGAKAGRAALPILLLTLGLGACASSLSSLPTELGGMPAGTPQPQQPAPAAYPAVHDMPPPRPDVVLTDAERKKAEAELMALRERQEKEAGTFPNAPPKAAKTKPRDADQKDDQKDQ